MPVPKHIVEQLKQLVPPLNGTLHKGQSGRVGVLGGAQDYTGAPFFAAISALRLGADLSHVICSPTAAGPIKTYSPDLIVHPILREGSSPEKIRPEMDSLLSRLHVLVLGPGLGRENYMQSYARMALAMACSRGMFVVLDADALWLVGEDVSVIKGYRRAVLTPNVMEFKRLSEKLSIDTDAPADRKAGLVSKALGGVTIVQKGAIDIIAVDTTGEAADLSKSKIDGGAKEAISEQLEIDVKGGYKRCGGQGDILSGTIGTILAWGKCYEDGVFGNGSIVTSRIPTLAAAGGCMVTRTASRFAFQKQGRALVTQDMIPELGEAFCDIFRDDAQFGDKGKM